MLASLLALQTQIAFAAYSMSETCAYLASGYIANPDDCQSYGYCNNGELVGTKKCADGFLFDTKLGYCNYAANVKCSSKLASTCSNIDSPLYVADPDDCSQACYCNGNGKYSCVKCPQSQYFNPNTRACVWSKDYSCPADSICRLVVDNSFVADPIICGNYFSCYGGSGLSTQCDSGYWFNAKTGNCENVNICEGSAVTPAPGVGPGVQNNLPSSKAACSAYVPQPEGQSYFVSDGETCMGYYVCDDATGPGTWHKCPMGSHFSQADQKCVTPYTVKCTHDRCANINQQYVSAIGCSSYQFCSNQTNIPAYGNSCAVLNPKFPYFDEFLGSCVNEIPSYAICSA